MEFGQCRVRLSIVDSAADALSFAVEPDGERATQAPGWR
jgi:hypothetical protein